MCNEIGYCAAVKAGGSCPKAEDTGVYKVGPYTFYRVAGENGFVWRYTIGTQRSLTRRYKTLEDAMLAALMESPGVVETTETYWRVKISREIYAYMDKTRRELPAPFGVVCTIIESVANMVGRMPVHPVTRQDNGTMVVEND
jgi:hypothetical protein